MSARLAILEMAVLPVHPTITSLHLTVSPAQLWEPTALNAHHRLNALPAPLDILEQHALLVQLATVEITAQHAQLASILQVNNAFHVLIIVPNVVSVRQSAPAPFARSAMMELIASSVILVIKTPTALPANTDITRLILAALVVVPALR